VGSYIWDLELGQKQALVFFYPNLAATVKLIII